MLFRRLKVVLYGQTIRIFPSKVMKDDFKKIKTHF